MNKRTKCPINFAKSVDRFYGELVREEGSKRSDGIFAGVIILILLWAGLILYSVSNGGLN